MSDMKCNECVLKHLATALSFAKEIISGHDENNELDHRIDFLGEISNAEQHLELIDKDLFNEISLFRKNIQAKDVKVSSSDLSFIRTLYRKVELLKNNESYKVTTSKYENDLDIIYLDVISLEQFDLSYKLLKKNLTNYGKIYVVNSSVDLSQYEVEQVDSSIFEFMKRDDLSDNVIFINENMSFANKFDARDIFPTYTNKSDIMPQVVQEFIKNTDKKGIQFRNFEDTKPQPINVKLFNELNLENCKYFTSVYFNSMDDVTPANENIVTVFVEKPVCCSVKSGLQFKRFVRWNDQGFKHVQTYYSL